MWQIVWEFRVAEEHRAEFEQVYGPAGDWAKLFARSPEFRGTTLLADPAVPGRYLTLDLWTNAKAFEEFQQQFRPEYLELDERCGNLTQYEMKVGAFNTVS